MITKNQAANPTMNIASFHSTQLSSPNRTVKVRAISTALSLLITLVALSVSGISNAHAAGTAIIDEAEFFSKSAKEEASKLIANTGNKEGTEIGLLVSSSRNSEKVNCVIVRPELVWKKQPNNIHQPDLPSLNGIGNARRISRKKFDCACQQDT